MKIYDGKKIAALRKDRGLSMEALGNLAGISNVAVFHLEHENTEKVSLKSLAGIARALGVPLQSLLRDVEVADQAPSDELTALYNTLSPANRAALIAAGQALVAAQSRRKK